MQLSYAVQRRLLLDWLSCERKEALGRGIMSYFDILVFSLIIQSSLYHFQQKYSEGKGQERHNRKQDLHRSASFSYRKKKKVKTIAYVFNYLDRCF